MKASREAGDTQFERGLGEHCRHCRRLDLLPLACHLCAEPFCSDCVGVDVHRCPSKHAQQARRVPDLTGWARPGDHVQLDGLVKAAEHNGKEAVVQRVALQRGSSGHDRFVIRTSSGTELAVKPKNMRHLSHPADPPRQQNEDLSSGDRDRETQPTDRARETERGGVSETEAETERGTESVRERLQPTVLSFRARSGEVVNSTLEFLLEAKLSRYTDQVSSLSVARSLAL